MELVHLIALLWLDETNEKTDQAFPTWTSSVLLLLAKPEFSVSILPDLPKMSSAVIKLNQNHHWSKSCLIFSQIFYRDEFFLTLQIASDLGKNYYISSYDPHCWSMPPPLPLLKRYLDRRLLGVIFIKLDAWNKRMTARKKQQLNVGKTWLRWLEGSRWRQWLKSYRNSPWNWLHWMQVQTQETPNHYVFLCKVITVFAETANAEAHVFIFHY